MKERIKELRQFLGLTQQEFAERLSLKRNTIATYEIGRSIPMNSTITSICREFGVNETWLRTGEGPMFAETSRADQVKAWLDKILVEEPDSYKVRLAAGLAELDEAGWQAIYSLAVKMVGAVAEQNAKQEEESEEDEEARLEKEAEMVKRSYIDSHRRKRPSASSGGGTNTG